MDSQTNHKTSPDELEISTNTRTQKPITLAEKVVSKIFFDQLLDRKQIEPEMDFDLQKDLKPLHRNSIANNSHSVLVQSNNRISVNFDINIPKSNRLTHRDNQPWTLIEDEKQVETISQSEINKTKIKAELFNLRYQYTTHQKITKPGLFQSIIKFCTSGVVEIKRESHLPIYLFHYKFQRTHNQKLIEEARAEFQDKFWSTIWCCYRQNFSPLLAKDNDCKSLKRAFDIRDPGRKVMLGQTNDIGWGCTVRVSQMLFSHSILRTKLGNYTMKTLINQKDYLRMLTLINDNKDGADGAFSIQNVARMSLVFDKNPGEWHGNKSISLVFSHLNKIYNPIDNFEVCLFGDETIYWDKVEKMGFKTEKYCLKTQLNNLEFLSEERQDKVLLIDALFKQFLKSDSSMQLIDQKHLQKQRPQTVQTKVWRNAVLVIICVRLGMNEVQQEYLPVLRDFFQQPLNVGILGGRPGEAYYLVGIQDEFLIFLDPHNTINAVEPDIEQISQNHMSYHETSAKKIHFSKLDPSLGFAYLLRSENDYQSLRKFIETGKSIHKKSWVFHAMNSKPDFIKSKSTDQDIASNRISARQSVRPVYTKDEFEKPQSRESSVSSSSKIKQRCTSFVDIEDELQDQVDIKSESKKQISDDDDYELI